MRRRGELAIGCVLALAWLSGCAPSSEEVDFTARKAVLERQNQGIRELIAEAERGTLVPSDSFLVGIDERVVAQVLSSQLPLERPLGKRFIIHLESATVRLRDKYGLVTIEGYIHREQTPDRRTSVRVIGGLGAVEIDSTTSLLTVRIAVDDVQLLEAGILEQVIGAGGKKFIAEKGKELLEDKLPVLQIPVSLAQKIKVPAIDQGALQLDSLVIPLDVSVQRVLAAGGKLWLTLHAEVDTVIGGEEGLGVTVAKKKKKQRPIVGHVIPDSTEQPPATPKSGTGGGS